MPSSKKSSEDNKNPWGNMLYLSTDVRHCIPVKEIRLEEGLQATLGYLFIAEDLKMFNATRAFTKADMNRTYDTLQPEDAGFALMTLIHNWFNKDEEGTEISGRPFEAGNVYTVTNHIARIIRERTNLDGIVYQSVKSKGTQYKCWNIALKDDSKVKWGYSELYDPICTGRYKKGCIELSEAYNGMRKWTENYLQYHQPSDFPVELRGFTRHVFP